MGAGHDILCETIAHQECSGRWCGEVGSQIGCGGEVQCSCRSFCSKGGNDAHWVLESIQGRRKSLFDIAKAHPLFPGVEFAGDGGKKSSVFIFAFFFYLCFSLILSHFFIIFLYLTVSLPFFLFISQFSISSSLSLSLCLLRSIFIILSQNFLLFINK